MIKKYFLFLKKIFPFLKTQKTSTLKLSPKEKVFTIIKNSEGNYVDIKEGLVFKGMNSFYFNAPHLNHRVNIGENFTFQDLTINIRGSNNTIIIGNNVRIKGKIKLTGQDITLKIGDNTTIQGASILASEANVTIGSNCMFSREIEIRSTDAHKIYVKGEKLPINTPKPVLIGDNVWLGARAFISKGAVIPSGCIIGAMSFVSKSLEKENTIYAGVPVKEIRTNISWKR